MYEKLVIRLRNHASDRDAMYEAANAIEELTAEIESTDSIKTQIKELCQRRKEVGAIPWDVRSKKSLNARVELHRIDGLIVEKVLEFFDERQKDQNV